jgi:hypothetical protein
MPVPLVSVKVYDHDPTDPMMSPGIMYDEGYIWVYAETSSIFLTCMMIPACQVDSPTMLKGKA